MWIVKNLKKKWEAGEEGGAKMYGLWTQRCRERGGQRREVEGRRETACGLRPRQTQSKQLINKAIKRIYQKRIGGNHVKMAGGRFGRRPLPAIILAVFISRN